MSDLILKITLFSFLSATIGFALGSWWSRRRSLVEAESHESMAASTNQRADSNWKILWHRLDAIPPPKDVNLQSLHERFDRVMDAVSRLERPAPNDLSGIERRLDSLSAAVADIPIPLSPRSVDLQPVLEKLDLIKRDFDRTTQ